MTWKEEMVEDLRQMWIEGLTANEIAKKLGVTKNSIVGKVHRLCLKARPSPIKRNDAVENTETLDVTEIKEKIEITENVEEETLDAVEVVEVKKSKKAPKSDTKEKSSAETKNSKSKASAKNENIKLMQLDSHTCRWPLGDPRDDDFCFCGKKVRAGQTYCDEHSQMAYVKASKR